MERQKSHMGFYAASHRRVLHALQAHSAKQLSYKCLRSMHPNCTAGKSTCQMTADCSDAPCTATTEDESTAYKEALTELQVFGRSETALLV